MRNELHSCIGAIVLDYTSANTQSNSNMTLTDYGVTKTKGYLYHVVAFYIFFCICQFAAYVL